MQANPARIAARVSEAEQVILSLVYSAAARLDGLAPRPNGQFAARIEALLQIEITARPEEAKNAAIFGGFAEHRGQSFRRAPGLATMLVAARSSGLAERGSCLPMPEVLRAGLALSLASEAMRTSVLRLNRWLHGAFLLNGGRHIPAFTSQAALSLLVAIELRAAFWSKIAGVDKLRSFASNEAAILFTYASPPAFADQLILCALCRKIMDEGSDLGTELPLAVLPLAAAPRFALVDGPFDRRIVPADFAPYFPQTKKAVA